MIRFGPAGWSYRDWAGIVYPRPRPRGFDELAYVSSYFDTIEINSTFYRPATDEVARSWIERSGGNPDFRFTLKMWRRFTHQRREAWSDDEVAQAREALDPIRDAGSLGAVLLQFPWSFRRTDENREWLDDVISAFPDLPLVLEVRHASWNTPELFGELLERGVGFVNIDQPRFRDSIGPSAHATSSVGYVRVHGRNYQDWWREGAEPHERYDYLYTADELLPWVERAREIAEPPTEDVYVITNNHYRGKAVANALMLRSIQEGRPVPAPAPLVAEYPDLLAGYSEAAGPG